MVSEAGSLYRYRNIEGNLVIDHEIPPEYVAGGYEVLSNTGRVEQVVPPHRVEPEEPEGDGGVVTSEDASQQLRDDQMLLRSYSEISELEAAKDRRLSQLTREVEIIQSNISKNQDMLVAARTKAANYQRSGQAVPELVLKNMDDLVILQKDAEQMLSLREREYAATKQRYSRYIERFMTLKGLEPLEKTQPSSPTTVPATALSDDG